MTTHLRISNDLGNGHMKIGIDNNRFILPSVVAFQRDQDLFDAVTFSSKEEEKNYMNNLLSELDVTVQSSEVRTAGRLLVGVAARKLPQSSRGFDVNDLEGKSGTDLSLILTLSTIAGYAVRNEYGRTNTIPTRVSVTVDMATALPITEGKRDAASARFAARYTKDTHVVTLHNFDHLVQVEIKFNAVFVALEGESAQYRLRRATDELANGVKADFDKHYPDMATLLSARELVESGDAMGVDIGDGTVDMPVFIDSELHVQMSSSLSEGYGNALEEAKDDLIAQRVNLHSRSELQELVTSVQPPLSRARQAKARDAVNAQLTNFGSRIVDAVSATLRKSSSSVSVIFVYGGGSTPMEPYLREVLMEKTKAFTGGDGIPVVFVPEEYAQDMNERGLRIILDVASGGDVDGE